MIVVNISPKTGYFENPTFSIGRLYLPVAEEPIGTYCTDIFVRGTPVATAAWPVSISLPRTVAQSPGRPKSGASSL